VIDWGSLKRPTREWISWALIAKWYLLPFINCVRVQAIGRGRAFTSPTFFQRDMAGCNPGVSWYAKM